jgi:hypothetical protein
MLETTLPVRRGARTVRITAHGKTLRIDACCANRVRGVVKRK